MSKQLSIDINKNESTKLSSQAELSAEKSQFYRDYYDLTSWKGSDGNTYDLTGSITASLDTILSAQWKPTEYSITYLLDGGTNGNNPTSYNIESETSALLDATKFQHTFDKWTENGNLILSIEQGSHGDKTLSASYIRTKVTGTYKCNWNVPLYFQSEAYGSTIALTKTGTPYEVTLVSSENGTDWGSYTIGTTYTYPSVGSRFYLRKADSDTSDKFSKDGSNCYYFSMTGRIAADGNIQWLLDSTGQSLTCTSYCYCKLFNDCKSLIQAPKLPAMTLAEYCYEHMFLYCTLLSSAPKLPAMTLAEACYSLMFVKCTSLTSAPELPATTLAIFCYDSMFSNCNNLSVTADPLGKQGAYLIFVALKTVFMYKQDMFTGTGGDFTGTPTTGVAYYCYGN